MTDQPIAPVLAWGAATHTGRVRTENEDAFVAEPMVFAVADGMGGHQAGEVASAIASTTMRDRLLAGAASVDVAVAAVVEANAAIFQGAHSNAEQRGMGTTLTAMVVLADHEGTGRRLALVNVGDSRTYVARGNQLRRVTIDHSYVQELVSTGHITEIEARTHPRRNIVTRALGIEPHVRVDTWVLPFVLGDRYVLCSDGLVDEVDDDEIAAILAANPTPQAAAEALVAAANAHGGRDNVTVVVVDVLDGALPPDAATDLDADVAWGEDDDDVPDRLIDAEAGVGVGAGADGPTLPAASRAVTTAQLPVTVSGTVAGPVPGARRFNVGGLLFALALGVIITLAVTLVLVVRHNANTTPDTTVPTTLVTTSSSTPAATTTVAESTVSPTTVPATAVPATTAP